MQGTPTLYFKSLNRSFTVLGVDRFDNWELAFAAYNAGSRRVMSALQHQPQSPFIDDLDLPLETKIYIKKLKILRQVMVKLSENNLKLETYLF
jgi:hypothetical protein